MKEDKIYDVYNVYFTGPDIYEDTEYDYIITANNMYINLIERVSATKSPASLNLSCFNNVIHGVNNVDVTVEINYYNKDHEYPYDYRYTSDKYNVNIM